MVMIIRYEELTWPEVVDLPRDIPFVLPIGEGYDLEQAAQQIQAARICLLPALPYGWQGSIAPVSEGMLQRVVTGVLSGLHEQGFSNLTVLHAGMERLDSKHVGQVMLPRDTTNDPQPLEANQQRVILIPCGHTEQHGYHLPLNTDTVIIGTIAERTVEAIPAEAETLPALPYGVSMYREAFAGTLNMGGRVFEDFLLEVIDGLVARGADRFYLMSGHGGNSSFLHNVVKYAGDKHHPIFATTAWLHTSGHLGGPALEQYRKSKIGGMGHACELETAYLLLLRPELCKMERVVDEPDFITTPNYYMDWIEGGALIMSATWEDDTLTGAYGSGSLATAETGAIWLGIAVEEKVIHVKEIHEQARLRLARRAEQEAANRNPMTVLAGQSWRK
ncbi:MAG: creatininase family protein [Chloroflexi bacterium]|nr:creatininase family protein [Chloroflexota bacterium]MCC6893735.1 creatininase family protein [Anaerolineae bacterium]